MSPRSLSDEEWGHTRDWGGCDLAARGVSRKDAKSQSLLARIGLPANHANVAHPPSDKAITPSSLHNYVARLSTFNFLPTNPG